MKQATQTQLKDKKITLATLKKFIKEDGLFLKVQSKFSGMTDGIESGKNVYEPVEKTERNVERSLGIEGMWCVGSSRDLFTYVNDGEYEGIEVYNSCGCVTIARKITQE